MFARVDFGPARFPGVGDNELVLRARAGDRGAALELLRRHVGLAARVALRYHAPHLSAADLLAEGLVGLLEAVRRFDGRAGVKFPTYAAHWVRARAARACLDGLSTKGNRSAFWGLGRAGRALHAAGRSATPEAIAAVLDLSLAEVEAAIASSSPRAGVEAAAVVADGRPGVEELIDAGERARAVRRAVASLPPRERLVVERRHLAEEPETLAEVGRRLGVSRERVRQIEQAGLERLRVALGRELA